MADTWEWDLSDLTMQISAGHQGPRAIGIRYYGIGFWTSPERHLTALVLRGAPKRYYGIGFSLSPERYLTALVLRGAERYGTA